MSDRAEYQRRQHLEALEHSALEIDLSGLTLEQINDPESFEHAVLSDLDNRRWIRSTRGLQLEARTCEVLGSKHGWPTPTGLMNRRACRLWLTLSVWNKRCWPAVRALEREAHWAAQKIAAREQSSKQRPRNVTGERERREAQIVGTTVKISAEYGYGTECSTCLLVSPPDTAFCLYCSHEQSHMKTISIARNFADTFHMRSSAKPDHSLRAVPMLTVEPDL